MSGMCKLNQSNFTRVTPPLTSEAVVARCVAQTDGVFTDSLFTDGFFTDGFFTDGFYSYSFFTKR